MKEYELFLPLTKNDGSPIPDQTIAEIGDLLLDQFGGVTFFPQPNEGRWRVAHVVYHDQIVIFRMYTAEVKKARKFLVRLKERLKKELEQEEILIVEKDARPL